MKRSGSRRRLMALVRKETRQLLRDRSNLAVGLVLPIVLILLFGYGLSFYLTDTRIGIVLEDRTPEARDLFSNFQGSLYVSPVVFASMADAQDAMRQNSIEAIVRVPPDFSRRLAAGGAEVQLLLNGVSSTTASTIESYVTGVIGVQAAKRADRAGAISGSGGGMVSVVQRMWFNEAGDSTWYLVPGLVVLVLTLIGTFLTSMLIVGERERGTLEALFVTPARPMEMLLAKLAPYLAIGIVDLTFCLLAARLVFDVPIRGSLWVIVLASILYLIVSLAMGLFISGRSASQFQASQVALLMSFMPAMMLSGFVFDLCNMPTAVRTISQLLPATHFMPLIKTLFLAGDDWPMIVRECGILCLYALLLINASRLTLRKKIG